MQSLERLSFFLSRRGFAEEGKLVKRLSKIGSKNELSLRQSLSFQGHDDGEAEFKRQKDKTILILSEVLAQRIDVPDSKMQTWLNSMRPKLNRELDWLISQLYEDFVFYYNSIFEEEFPSEWEVGKGDFRRTVKVPGPENYPFLGSITPENNPISSEDEREALGEASLRMAVLLAMKITLFGMLELKDSLTLKDIAIDIYDKFGKEITTQMLRVVEDFEAIGEGYKKTVIEGDAPDDFIDIGFFKEDEDEYWGDH